MQYYLSRMHLMMTEFANLSIASHQNAEDPRLDLFVMTDFLFGLD